ncbi:hypothetical protein Rhe02_20410 [Rhizocola hellebori]|uniref:eCIS core domain-containing protein n=1 Tax=Rhizocola hellebori TaxID=1392758 RepID=A0A8J3Q526_9ACTN|nr:DUF4157 domain-containing protein [Rhizocola hellebori]GIH03974.1 hypothetical protein Rhe02_20410 [Rhizocola hellebori]
MGDEAVHAPKTPVSAPVHSKLINDLEQDPGRPMETDVAQEMGARLGFDFSGVRIHTDARAQASARTLGAQAFTMGSEVAFARDRYSPHSAQGAQLLAHELAHVVEQHDRSTAMIQCAPDPAAEEGVIPLDQLVKDIAAVEAAYPVDDPHRILTRIRSLYYSGVRWNSAFPEQRARDVYPSMMTIDQAPQDAQTRLKSQAVEYKPLNIKNPSPFILLPGGERIDFGHLVLGAEAILHPRIEDPYTSYGVSGLDITGWIADVGIASVWQTRAEEAADPQRTEQNLSPHPQAPKSSQRLTGDDYWNISASPEDLLGDVDTHGFTENLKPGKNMKLSQALSSFYDPKTGGVRKRFQTFCSAYGITYQVDAAKTVTWLEDWKPAMIKRIDNFNDLYNAGERTAHLALSPGTDQRRRTWPRTPEMLNRFLAWLKPRLESELKQ